MTIEVKLPNLSFVAQPTPWDDEIIGGKTTGIEFKDASENLLEARKEFLEWTKNQNIIFCFTKFEPENLKLRPIAHALGFYFVNSTTEALLRNVRQEQFSYSGEWTCKKILDSQNFDKILQMNITQMKHGRFQEDYFLNNLAAQRQTVILKKQLANPNFTFLATFSTSKELVGYTIASCSEGTADLIAMGINHEYSQSDGGSAFWKLNLRTLVQLSNIKRIKARMTATNTGVLNIYSRLGFLFHSPKDEYSWYQPSQLAFN